MRSSPSLILRAHNSLFHNLGGSLNDFGHAITVDGTGNMYVEGYTELIDFPVVNGLLPTCCDPEGIFVSEISPSGSSLIFSQSWAWQRRIYAIALDANRNIYVVGGSGVGVLISSPLFMSPWFSGEAFISEFAASGSPFISFFAGGGPDSAESLAFDLGDLLVAGETSSNDLPMIDAVDTAVGQLRVQGTSW